MKIPTKILNRRSSSQDAWSRLISLVFSLCLLSACVSWDDTYSKPPPNKPSATTRTPPKQAPKTTSTRPAGKRPSTHTVRSGEGFWTIARRYGISVEQLTSWNNMSKNDVIFKGMKLKLYPSASSSQPASAGSSNTSRSSSTNGAPHAIKLQWPLQGRIISKFNAQNRTIKGLEIGGLEGQRVRAAASGRVVYAGSGLVGLGNVIIIKHDSTYITAYGHNDKLLKIEGESVQKGEELAIIGEGPNNQTMLYFEVRKNGKPVDPLAYLK